MDYGGSMRKLSEDDGRCGSATYYNRVFGRWAEVMRITGYGYGLWPFIRNSCAGYGVLHTSIEQHSDIA